MPRNILNSKIDDFESKKKNPLGLLDDSNLDAELKTLLIGGEPSGLELSKTNTRINTNLEVDSLFVSSEMTCNQVIGNIKSTGGIYLDDTQKLVFNNNSLGVFGGNTYFTSTSTGAINYLDLYVGGQQLIRFQQGGLAVEVATIYDTDLRISKDRKLIFDEDDDLDYIWLTGNCLEFYVSSTKLLDLDSDGTILVKNDFKLDATTDGEFKFTETTSAPDVDCLHIDSVFIAIPQGSKVLLDGASGHTYIQASEDGAEDILNFCVGADVALSILEGSGLNRLVIPTAWKLYLDGDGTMVGGNTYVSESSADVLDFYVGALNILKLDEANDKVEVGGADLEIDATKKLALDGGGDTYMYEASADVVRHVVGGDILMTMSEKGDDGNEIAFGGCAGFNQIEPTYDATATLVDFRFSNKQLVTFSGGNITNLTLTFPLVSGNFVLLLKQDGTGSRTITNYKAMEFDESSADGSAAVVFAGGSNPTLTTDANHVDILSFYWDADNEIAYGVATLDFQF